MLGDNYMGRQKQDDRRWAVLARAGGERAEVIALVGGGSTRRLEEVQSLVPVEVVRPDLIDLVQLRAELVVKNKEAA